MRNKGLGSMGIFAILGAMSGLASAYIGGSRSDILPDDPAPRKKARSRVAEIKGSVSDLSAKSHGSGVSKRAARRKSHTSRDGRA